MSLILACDFDGTLCENAWPNIGEPKYDVINKVKKMKQDGWKVILWTCREGVHLTNAVEFCKSHGLEFDAVNDELDEVKQRFNKGAEIRDTVLKGGRCGAKIFANHYLDDRSLTIEDFLEE